MDIKSMTDAEILKIITPITETMETGWDKNDYEVFTRNFSKEMKDAVNLENYTQQRNNIFETLGFHTKLEVVHIHRNPDNITAIWNLHLEKRTSPALLMISYVNNNNKIEIVSAIHKH